MEKQYDYLIVGAGIIGLTLAYTIKRKRPSSTVLIIDKEKDVACHASSRNSGVLHAGFYYTADSLKAQLTVKGNRMMKEYCKLKGLPVNECGKLVVAQNEEELGQLYELEKRGKANGSNIRIIDEGEAKDIDANAKTYKKALHSPDTASIDPKAVCVTLRDDLKGLGVDFAFRTRYLTYKGRTIETDNGEIMFRKLINCAGLYADKIAQDFGFGNAYTIIPFKGIYLKYTKNTTDVKVNIYPVPNLRNPFLGVHFTKTFDGGIKIGPTAIPAFWRENYQGFQNFDIDEFCLILLREAQLFLTNAFKFRDLAFEEIKKYNRDYFVTLAAQMVHQIDEDGFTSYTQPGIRAQLMDKKSLSLLQDFVVEGDRQSVHILNAVSPAFTCSFPFTEMVFEKYL